MHRVPDLCTCFECMRQADAAPALCSHLRAGASAQSRLITTRSRFPLRQLQIWVSRKHGSESARATAAARGSSRLTSEERVGGSALLRPERGQCGAPCEEKRAGHGVLAREVRLRGPLARQRLGDALGTRALHPKLQPRTALLVVERILFLPLPVNSPLMPAPEQIRVEAMTA